MKVVLDTNVFISGTFWEGDSYKVLVLWKENKIDIITSKEIIDEISRTLSNFKIQLYGELLKDWINTIKNNSILVNPKEKITIVKDDPTDNKFIEAAVEGLAQYIVTNDKHLLKINIFRNIHITTPKEFLEIVP